MNKVITAAEQPEKFLPLLKGKRVAFAGNQTSSTGKEHTLDFLIGAGMDVVKIFGPEHGFRLMADDAVAVADGIDTKTGLPVISLYGAVEKPTEEHLRDVDIIVYDIQDVGVRFYTYISTLSYIMEAAAEQGKKVLVFDRPNPNGHYMDGNILDLDYSTFVGRHAVPVAYGMTVGEYALMMNGEGWLKNGIKCDLEIVPCLNYDRKAAYSLPIKPSPNLYDDECINLYPSTCFFEGTALSEGRGTEAPFSIFGSPKLPDTGFSFTPEPRPGAAEPRFKGKLCNGRDLRGTPRLSRVNLEWLVWAYANYPDKDNFFIPFFNNLAGGTTIKKQIISGMSAEDIRESWKQGLESFNKIRTRYLIYKDF